MHDAIEDRIVPRRIVSTLAVLPLALFVASCATNTSLPAQAYSGADTVISASTEDFLGSWELTVLNPLEGQDTNPTTATYSEGGTFTSTISSAQNSDDSALSETQLTLTGNWSLTADVLTHANLQVSALEDDPIGSLMAHLLNSRPQELGGSANLYERSDNHLILVNEEGVATRYDRR